MMKQLCMFADMLTICASSLQIRLNYTRTKWFDKDILKRAKDAVVTKSAVLLTLHVWLKPYLIFLREEQNTQIGYLFIWQYDVAN